MSAGPLEEAEEPQTLEQRHRGEKREAAEGQNATEVADTEKDDEKRKAKHSGEEVRQQSGDRGKKLVSKRNSTGSIAKQLICTFPIRTLLCCIFYSSANEAFLSPQSENLTHQQLIKSKAKAVGSNRFLLQLQGRT